MRKYCVITLRSVFVQGIRALDTLSPYIYYELLLEVMSFWIFWKASGKDLLRSVTY